MEKEITFYREDDNGEEIEVCLSLPAKFEVCPECEGHGKVDHPAFSDGITASEWEEDWDYEDRENYMNGLYDVVCPECNGKRLIVVVNEYLLDDEQKKLYDEWCDCQAAAAEFDYYCRMEQESERRMGC